MGSQNDDLLEGEGSDNVTVRLTFSLEDRRHVLHGALMEGGEIELGAEAGVDVPVPVSLVTSCLYLHRVPASANDTLAAGRCRRVVYRAIDQIPLGRKALGKCWTAASRIGRKLGQLLRARDRRIGG